ncbi:hypothetical protein [Acidocella sp.]|jgi:hypothetical protein|uniref:hypothetical protein n=1 Tax=Acidocella sp. TaxID=50710 RepID=UPI002F40F592
MLRIVSWFLFVFALYEVVQMFAFLYTLPYSALLWLMRLVHLYHGDMEFSVSSWHPWFYSTAIYAALIALVFWLFRPDPRKVVKVLGFLGNGLNAIVQWACTVGTGKRKSSSGINLAAGLTGFIIGFQSVRNSNKFRR